MRTVTTTISSTTVKVQIGSIRRGRTIDLRSTLAFTVIDEAGTASYQPMQPVVVTDSVSGVVFTGYVATAKKEPITPNLPGTYIDIDCVDNTRLVDKGYSKRDYENWYAGDIACDLHANYLAQLGIIAKYAMRRDSTAAQFTQGTLSSTVGASNLGDGNLELAPSGTQVSVTGAGAGFGLGAGLLFTGYASSGYSNAYNYRQIWAGSQSISNGLGDYLTYDVWVASSSPQIMSAVDFICSDGTTLRDSVALDLQGLSAHPNTDLSGLANDQWYSRTIFMPSSLNNKTISLFSVAFEGDNQGTYTTYFRNIVYHFNTGSGYTSTNIFTSSLQMNSQISTNGYSNASLTQVLVEDKSGTFGHTAFDISAAGIVRDSYMSWEELLPEGCTGYVQTSIDGGASWQTIANRGPVPNLQAGMVATGRMVDYRHTLTIGSDPTVNMGFGAPTLVVNPSYVSSKTDVVTSYKSQANFNTGTNTTTVNPSGGGVTLNGVTRTWDNADYSSQTQYSSGGGGTAVVNKQLKLTSNNLQDCRSRLDFAGTWQNFTAEVDVQAKASCDLDIEYRTTNFGTSKDSYAYAAGLQTTGVFLGRGTNTTGAGGFTSIATAAATFTAGSWHRLKVVVSGSNHKVYVDNIKLIDATDSTWSAAGNVSLRFFNNGTGSAASGLFDNFGVCAALSGTWQSPSINIAGPGTYGSSMVAWDTAQTPDTTAITVETSINAGSSWQSVTNGGAISGLTAGQSLASLTLLLRATLTANNAPIEPTLGGITAWVQGQYSSSGTRISPALSLASVDGAAGSTLVSWNEDVPAGTAVMVATSPTGSGSWTNTTSGGSIASVTTQPDPTDDTFDTNTSSLYTASSLVSPATWTWNTANSRLIATGGAMALLLYTSISCLDVDLMIDMDQSDTGGCVWRYVNANNYYQIIVNDASSTNDTNVITLVKRVGGTRSFLAAGSIAFVRGTKRRIRVLMRSGSITVYFDGDVALSYIDPSPLAAGKVGLSHDNGTSHFYQFRIQPYTATVVGQNTYTRATLISTDPTATPRIADLTASVHGLNIANGALIPEAKYSLLSGSKDNIAANLDDAAQKSDLVWLVDDDKELFFRGRSAEPSPWIATGDYIKITSIPRLETNADLYCNVQFANGGKDTLALERSFVGTGEITNWTMGYPVDSLTSITINDVSATFGVKNVDTGKDFYYAQGDAVIIPDAATGAYVSSQTITFAFDAQIDNVVVEMRDDAQIAIKAALDGTDGIVQAVEDAAGLSKVAMIQLVASRLAQNAVDSETFTFRTERDGLDAGQILTVFLSALSLADAQYLITDVQLAYDAQTDSSHHEKEQPVYDVTVISGALLGDWVRWLSNLTKGAA